MRVPAPLKSIADQVIRSASSVPANLAEGQGRSGRDRQHFWRIAYASAKEVDSHLRLLAHAGVLDGRGTATVLATFDEVRAMTWRLLNPRDDPGLCSRAHLDTVAVHCSCHCRRPGRC
jgi:four helix bundle protein